MLIVDDDKMAEGALNPDETHPTALKTTLMPAIQPDLQLPSLTGTTETVTMSEDTDKIDHQDAPLTPQETQPADDVTPIQTPTERAVPPVDTTTQKYALVVEDTVELGEVIVATLENMGLQTAYATHGKQGLAKIRESHPDIVLMDIGLPDITGWKMLDDIKEHYETIRRPLPIIIVITAYGDPANRLIGKLQNIYTYLLKPFTPDEVERVVNHALRGAPPPEVDATNNKPLD